MIITEDLRCAQPSEIVEQLVVTHQPYQHGVGKHYGKKATIAQILTDPEKKIVLGSSPQGPSYYVQ